VWDAAVSGWVEAPVPSLEVSPLPDGRTLYRVGIPRAAIRWQANALMGVRIALTGERGWVSAFEPWVLMQTRLVHGAQ
jgi:hypothetical protein